MGAVVSSSNPSPSSSVSSVLDLHFTWFHIYTHNTISLIAEVLRPITLGPVCAVRVRWTLGEAWTQQEAEGQGRCGGGVLGVAFDLDSSTDALLFLFSSPGFTILSATPCGSFNAPFEFEIGGSGVRAGSEEWQRQW